MMRITKPTQRMHSTYKATAIPTLNKRKQSTQQQIEEINEALEAPQLIHCRSTQQQLPQRKPRFQDSFMVSSCPRTVIAPQLIPSMMSTPLISYVSEIPQLKIVSAKNLFMTSSSKLMDLETNKNNSHQMSAMIDQNNLKTAAPLPLEKPIIHKESIRPKANSAWSPSIVGNTAQNSQNNGDINPGTRGQPLAAFIRTSPNNIHLEALNQFPLGFQNQGSSLGERGSKLTNRLFSEKPTEQKESQDDPDDHNTIQSSSSLQRKNEIIQRKNIPSSQQKRVQQQQQSSSSSTSFKSPQPTTGLIHRPYQSKQLGFAFKPTTVPSYSSSSQFSVKCPVLNLKSSRSSGDPNNIQQIQSAEQISRKISTINQQISSANSSSSPKAPQLPYETTPQLSQQQHSYRKLRAFSNEKYMDQILEKQLLQKKNKRNTMNLFTDTKDETTNYYENSTYSEITPNNTKKLNNPCNTAMGQQPHHSIESTRSQKSASIPEKPTSLPQRQYRIISRNIANMSESKKNNKTNSSSYQIGTNTWKIECSSQSPLQQSSQSPSFSSQDNFSQQTAKALSANQIQNSNEKDNAINMHMWQPSNQWIPEYDQHHNNPVVNEQYPTTAVVIMEADKTSNIGSCSNNPVSSQVVKIGKKMIKIINPYRDRIRKNSINRNNLDDQSQKLENEKDIEQERTNQQFYFGGIGQDIEGITDKIKSSNNRSYQHARKQQQKQQQQQQQSDSSTESTKENDQETCFKKTIPCDQFDNSKTCNSARDISTNIHRISRLNNVDINHVNVLSISNKWRQIERNKQTRQEDIIGDQMIFAKEKKVVSAKMLTEMLQRVQQNKNNNILNINEQKKDGDLIGNIGEDINRKIFNYGNADCGEEEFEVIMQIGSNNNQQDESYSMSSTLRDIVQLIAQ